MAEAHVVVFPFPMPGHYIPLSTFAHSLASCDASIRVSLILTEATAQKWRQQHDGGDGDGAGDDKVQIVAISDGLPLHFDRSANHGIFIGSAQRMGPTLQRCLEELHSSWPISCLISEPFFSWVQEVANHLSLPLFLFFTDSAAVVSTALHTQRLLSDGLIGHGASKHGDVVVEDIPGVPALPARDLPFPEQEKSEVMFKMRVGMEGQIGEAAGVLLNTCNELEEAAVGFAARYLSKPVLAVGPCVPELMVQESSGVGPCKYMNEEEEELMQWLDAKEAASLIYVSFTTLPVAEEENFTREIWEGLRASKQPFLWTTRSALVNSLLADIHAEEQQARVVPWAPQQRVLSHPSVGAFMTHCGWNAALEGVTAGVPMLCFPHFLDQPLTSALIVKVWRVGLQVVQAAHRPLLQRSAVQRLIRLLLHEEDGKLIKQRASLLRQTVLTSLRRSPPGSSIQSLHSLIDLAKHMHVPQSS